MTVCQSRFFCFSVLNLASFLSFLETASCSRDCLDIASHFWKMGWKQELIAVCRTIEGPAGGGCRAEPHRLEVPARFGAGKHRHSRVNTVRTRCRRVESGAEASLFEQLLTLCKAPGLLKECGKQRTDLHQCRSAQAKSSGTGGRDALPRLGCAGPSDIGLAAVGAAAGMVGTLQPTAD